jgi:hypothetical protein
MGKKRARPAAGEGQETTKGPGPAIKKAKGVKKTKPGKEPQLSKGQRRRRAKAAMKALDPTGEGLAKKIQALAAPEAPASDGGAPAGPGQLSALQEKYRQKLEGAQFRMLNEMLYTNTGATARTSFVAEPDLFEAVSSCPLLARSCVLQLRRVTLGLAVPQGLPRAGVQVAAEPAGLDHQVAREAAHGSCRGLRVRRGQARSKCAQ